MGDVILNPDLEKTYLDVLIEIKRVADGVIASGVWKNWYWNTYWWEEGNASCDCNRKLFFTGFHEPDIELEDDQTPCGDDAYVVRISHNDTKEVLYDEFE